MLLNNATNKHNQTQHTKHINLKQQQQNATHRT